MTGKKKSGSRAQKTMSSAQSYAAFYLLAVFHLSKLLCRILSVRVPKWKKGDRTLVVFLSMLHPQRIKKIQLPDFSSVQNLSPEVLYLSKPGLNSGVTRVAELSQLSHACHHRLLLRTYIRHIPQMHGKSSLVRTARYQLYTIRVNPAYRKSVYLMKKNKGRFL